MSEEASILIVDDDAEDLASLTRALEALVATIHSVRDPHEVLEATHRENPDVVILDALLPGLSGFDLCKQIKSDSALKGIQVVVITGVYLRQQYRHEALQQFKADGFMTKPYKPPELQRLVAQLLAKKTRRPQKSFLRRSGLAAPPPEAKKRGFWDRLFGSTEPEEADTRIAPVASPPLAAPMASAPKPDPGRSHVALAETSAVTKLDEPEPVAEIESPKSASAPLGSRTATEPESKPDAVVESAGTIAVSPDAPIQKSEEPAITTESSSAGSKPIATVDEVPDADDARGIATEPVAEAASVEVEETASVVDKSSAEPESAAPAVYEKPSAADTKPVPEAAEEDQERVEPSQADAAAPAAPAKPTAPAELAAPGKPAAPAASAKPAAPAASAKSAEPAAPAKPAEPAAPAKSAAPAAPAKSAEPAAPAKPAEPAAPAKSAEPATSAKPAEPAASAKPAKPAEPTAPAAPAAPADLAASAKPAAPTVPAAPAKRTKPAEAAASAGPASPTAPAERVASASSSEASKKEGDEAPPEKETRDAPAGMLDRAPPAEAAREDKEVQRTAEPASSAALGTQALPEKPAPELPQLRKPRFRVRDVPIYGEQDFHAELKREISKCRRVDRPLTLILVQVDDLGQIVELFGKEAREGVLLHVAELATWCVREIDVVGMMSSKDLVALIAFASDKYGGSRVVDRMRKTVQKNPFRVGQELPPIMPALRFGMSSYPDDGEDVAGLVAEAYEDIED